MEISLFQPEDAAACIEIFDSNLPDYFLPQEKEGFTSFLSHLPPTVTYFVARDPSQRLIACGGVKLDEEHHMAKLRWDIVLRAFHRQGIGRALTQHRLAWIAQNPTIHLVRVGTSQFAVDFYERMGFNRYQFKKDGIAPGMDEYRLELRLDARKENEIF